MTHQIKEEQLDANTPCDDGVCMNELDYKLWAAKEAIQTSRRQLTRYQQGAADAWSARLAANEKYETLLCKYLEAQGQISSLQNDLDMRQSKQVESDRALADYVERVDEESFRNDKLNFQLEQTQNEVQECREIIKDMNEKLRGVPEPALLRSMEADVVVDREELAALRLSVQQWSQLVDRLLKTCDILRDECRLRCEERDAKTTELSASLSEHQTSINALASEMQSQLKRMENESSTACFERDTANGKNETIQALLSASEWRNTLLYRNLEALINLKFLSGCKQLGSDQLLRNRRAAEGNNPPSFDYRTAPRRNPRRQCRA